MTNQNRRHKKQSRDSTSSSSSSSSSMTSSSSSKSSSSSDSSISTCIGGRGPRGPRGPKGEDGKNGVNVLEFAEFYGISNAIDYPTSIAVNAPLQFPHDGAASGNIVRNSGSPFDFLLPNPGVYLITWQASISEPAQLTLFLDPNSGTFTRVPNTTVGRATGMTQLVGNTLLQVYIPFSKIRIVNDASPAAITVTPVPGGTEDASVSLTIVKVA